MCSRCFVPLVLACAPAWSQGWQPLDGHPRPDWARPWVNLNGAWQFDFDPEDAGLRDHWYENHTYGRTIQVPFPWQSELSGIHDTAYNGVAWYQRDIAIPSDAGPRLFLVFGAVDWLATVWVNGKEMATHEGGYVPFDVEITELAKPGESIHVTVRAVDRTEPDLPTGKQIGWYTQTGGIWQTVYLESRGNAFIQQGHIFPDIDQQRAEVRLTLNAPAAGTHTVKVTAKHGEQTVEASQEVTLQAGENQASVALPIPDPALWSPDSPALYDTGIELLQNAKAVDTVRTYFGMRKISRGTYGGSAQEYILLNNKPIYLRGALHQSFNPKGIYTHPDDDFIRLDYEKTTQFGLNCLRIHIKMEEPRALYWADKLGVMLMCDVPNFWKKSDRSNAAWEATLRAQVARDFYHPAI
ncbi:MAG: glycoside hydrolase family 2, partial [Candidatus Hydrogenedentes bacterium]|nr:glycoside hydrolase family 2 [Candidatus Hydrogenedentota bacterium]